MAIIWVTCIPLIVLLTANFGSSADDDNFNLSQSLSTARQCINQEKNVTGTCVLYTYCDDDHQLIQNVDLRKGECAGLYDWCCYRPSDVTQLDDRSPEVCLNSSMKEGSCSWCAALYRDGGHPNTKSPDGLFCAGAVVGKRAVLTAATCLLSAMDQKITVRIQGKENALKRAMAHIYCNSGTKKYDVAILELEDDVEGEIACIASSEKDGDCFGLGFGPDTDQTFYDTAQQTNVVEVTKGRCGARGSSPAGAVCAKVTNDCSLSVGSPVVCGGQIVGVASSRGCSRVNSLGGVDSTSLLDPGVQTWVEATLKALSTSTSSAPSKDWHTKCITY